MLEKFSKDFQKRPTGIPCIKMTLNWKQLRKHVFLRMKCNFESSTLLHQFAIYFGFLFFLQIEKNSFFFWQFENNFRFLRIIIIPKADLAKNEKGEENWI